MDAESWGLIWLIVAAVFLFGELVVPGFILLPFGISAAVAALLGFAGVSPAIGWLVFILGGGIGFAILWKYARSSLDELPNPKGVGADRLLGTTGTVITEITGGPTGNGMVLLEAEKWRAEAADQRPIAVGVDIEVVEVRGTRVVVRILGGGF